MFLTVWWQATGVDHALTTHYIKLSNNHSSNLVECTAKDLGQSKSGALKAKYIFLDLKWYCFTIVDNCPSYWFVLLRSQYHYSDVIMDAMASQFTSPTIVYSTVYSGGDQRKYQSSTSLAFARGIHRWPVNSPHKWPVTWKIFTWWRHHVLGTLGQYNGWWCLASLRLQQPWYWPHKIDKS